MKKDYGKWPSHLKTVSKLRIHNKIKCLPTTSFHKSVLGKHYYSLFKKTFFELKFFVVNLFFSSPINNPSSVYFLVKSVKFEHWRGLKDTVLGHLINIQFQVRWALVVCS
jgi:hypothetical protein